MSKTEEITVTCYAGYKADERPTSFERGKTVLAVAEVLDRWYDQDGNYFKVRAEDSKEYLLRHDLDQDRWELVTDKKERGEEP
ncbi:hypothetical protein [Geoanaerobacter pelophilus]|nr:hypothetical protein [Geoanaerobacter pelophilus]